MLASPIETPRYAREFPAFPAAAMPALGKEWRDDSWHNDSCPSFHNDALGLKLWIDWPDECDRMLEGGARFMVQRSHWGGKHGWQAPMSAESVWSGIAWHDCAARLASLWEEARDAIASRFSLNLLAELGRDTLAEVVARNHGHGALVCASHDFCDANMPMAEAFEAVTGAPVDPGTYAHALLWSEAWGKAKADAFGLRIMPTLAAQIEASARIDDLGDAVSPLQDILGQDDGGLAGMAFSACDGAEFYLWGVNGFSCNATLWEGLDKASRAEVLARYVRQELAGGGSMMTEDQASLAFTAACLWEAAIDADLWGVGKGDLGKRLVAYRERNGTAQLRDDVCRMASACDAAWQAMTEEQREEAGAFDWEFVPAWLAANWEG